MTRRLILLIGLFAWTCAPVSAQLRPGAFTTVTVTDTSATALKVGCAVGAAPPCTGTVVAGAISVAGVGIINSSGKIPAISSTYFTSLDGSNLTNVALLNAANTFTVGPIALSAATATNYIELKPGGTRKALIGMSGAIKGSAAVDLGFFTETGQGMTWMVNGSATDAMTLSTAGVLTVSGFGVHTFSAGGTGGNYIKIRNTAAGAANFAQLSLGNDGTADAAQLYHTASNYTTGAIDVQDALIVQGTRAGGISLAASHASGAIRFYSGGTTLRGQFITTGGLELSSGTVSAPGLAFINSTNSGLLYSSAVYIVESGIGVASFVAEAGVSGNSGSISAGAFGTGNVTGSVFSIGRNTSGSGATGSLLVHELNGTLAYLWPDATGDWRTAAVPPDEDGTPADTSGTVLGDQTSTRASKNVLGEFTADAFALQTILNTPLYRFTYKSGSRNHTEFVGILAEESPTFTMDLGRVFNPITTSAYLMAAIKELQRQIIELRKDRP